MTDKPNFTSLRGQFLIAMPNMGDSRFARSVIYICEHTEKGTMGIVVNKTMGGMSFADLLEQANGLDNTSSKAASFKMKQVDIHRGGPVETGRGFVLHSSDYHLDDMTAQIDKDVSLTETLEVLKALARGDGPDRAFIALGYAGWSAGQLEGEIRSNGWLHAPSTPEIIFGSDPAAKYNQALALIGIEPAALSSYAGHS